MPIPKAPAGVAPGRRGQGVNQRACFQLVTEGRSLCRRVIASSGSQGPRR
jgi:hypothetical protein